MLVLALLGFEHLHEVGQIYPLASIAFAFAHLAGQIASELLAIPVDGLANAD